MKKHILRFLIKQHEAGKILGRDKIAEQFGISGHEARIYAYISKHMDEVLETARGEVQVKEVNQALVKPNVLVLDIETAPLLVRTWGLWKQNISTEAIVRDWFMLTWAVKWLYEPDYYSGKLTPKEARNGDDKRIAKEIWPFVEKADIIIAHNGRRFDMPRLNTRFILAGLGPPAPYAQIDTLDVARRNFAFSSNKLDYINKLFQIDRKISTGFKLWNLCCEGDEESLDHMESYNINDVGILEEHYSIVRPWIKSHPNMGLFVEGDGAKCPTCGSIKIKWLDKFYTTSVNKYSCFRCECGAIGRSRHTAISRAEKQNVLQSTAR